MYKRIALFLVIISGVTAYAQTGKVRGFVFEKKTDSPVPFANATIAGTTLGAVANDEGYFIISDVPLGKVDVVVSFVGYKSQTITVEVLENKIENLKFYLDDSSEMLNDVNINGERKERENKVLTGVVKLMPKQIKQFSVGGDADLIKAIQVLPGVVTTGDQGGQVYIRGGAPIQNLILLDGMVVYNPFHSIGFFSVFDVDIIQSADVYSGGFNAEYGSRNSAVMDVKTRTPNRRRFAGKVSASTYSSKLLLEAPLGAKNKNGQSLSSFMMSGKVSYLDKTSSVFYPHVETEYGDLPFSFADLYAKYNVQTDNGSSFNLFGFSFNDKVSFGGNNDINWNSLGVGGNINVVPPASSVLLGIDFALTDYGITSVENGGAPDESSIVGWNFGLDFSYFLRKSDEFKYGIEAIGYTTELDLKTETGLSVLEKENTTELGAYFQYKLKTGRLILQPGFRAHYYSSLSEFSPEPRLGLKYNITDFLRFKAATGLYSQNLVASNNDRDVVNLFYGFLSGADVKGDFRGEPITSNLQKAVHYIAGFEVELSKNLTLNIEGYIKDFKQLTNVNRNKLYDENDPDQPDILKKNYIAEQGIAKGVDFLAKYRSDRLYLWFVYSLGKITRDDGLIEYAPHFDRRHNLNLVGNYMLDKKKTWELSTRYNFGSGFPFTPDQLNYSKKPFVDAGGGGQIAYDYTTENGTTGVLYGDLNSNRLPNYHRVDVSITKTISFSETKILEVSAGATNILNYENIFYYDRVDKERVNQLPIMPSLSCSFSF